MQTHHGPKSCDRLALATVVQSELFDLSGLCRLQYNTILRLLTSLCIEHQAPQVCLFFVYCHLTWKPPRLSRVCRSALSPSELPCVCTPFSLAHLPCVCTPFSLAHLRLVGAWKPPVASLSAHHSQLKFGFKWIVVVGARCPGSVGPSVHIRSASTPSTVLRAHSSLSSLHQIHERCVSFWQW